MLRGKSRRFFLRLKPGHIGSFLVGAGFTVILEQFVFEFPHPLIIAIVVILFGVFFIIGERKLSSWQGQQLGLFCGIYAVRKGYDERRITQSLKDFEQWVHDQYPTADIRSGFRPIVETRPELEQALQEVSVTLTATHGKTHAGSNGLCLWFGGRLDAVFWFGHELGRGLSANGRILALSDTESPEDEFVIVGALDGQPVSSNFAVPSAVTKQSEQKNSGRYAMALLHDRTPGPIVPGIWCRTAENPQWVACDHQGQHGGDLILGIDTRAIANNPTNRLVTTTGQSKCFADDVVLALVTTKGLEVSVAAHAVFMNEANDCYMEAKKRFAGSGPARQLIALACPPTVAALAGSALRDQGTWHTLNDVKADNGQRVYELSYEKEV